MRGTKIVAGLVFATLLVATVGAEEEPEKIDLGLAPSKWKVGETLDHSGSISVDLEVYRGIGNVVKQATFKQGDGWAVAVRRDELDADGATKKAMAFFQSGYLMRDDKADQDVAGVRISIEGDSWSDADGRHSPSSATSRWLDDVFVPEHLPAMDLGFVTALDPGGKVAVGDTWEVSAEPLGKRVAKLWGMKFDLRKAKAQCKLDSVRGKGAHRWMRIEVTMELPIRDLPHRTGKARAKLVEPQVLRIAETYDLNLDGHLRQAQVATSSILQTSVTVNGEEASLRLMCSVHYGTRLDGWVPNPDQIR